MGTVSDASTVKKEKATVLFPDKSVEEETDEFTASGKPISDTSKLPVYEEV